MEQGKMSEAQQFHPHMTVEACIYQLAAQLKHNLSQKCEIDRQKLKTELESVKAELREKQREVGATNDSQSDSTFKDQNDENNRPSTAPSSASTTVIGTNNTKAQKSTAIANDSNKGEEASSNPTGIFVEVRTGPYKGKTYQLHPKYREPCFVGRSRGKKFLERGISLQNDQEVSTTHAKFEGKKGKFFFTDSNSTNGSYREDGSLIAHGVPVELTDGIVIKVGQSELLITLLS